MKKQIIIAVSILIILFYVQSCTQDIDNNVVKNNYEFTYISACGWCGGSYELRITNNIASFEYLAVCDNEPRSFERELTNDEIESLNLSKLYAEVKLLDLNNCGVCFDGCDETIKFNEGENEYSIRFFNDKEVDHILAYISAIRDLFDSMNNESLEE